jgi:hypothetical protein
LATAFSIFVQSTSATYLAVRTTSFRGYGVQISDAARPSVLGCFTKWLAARRKSFSVSRPAPHDVARYR